VKRLKCLVHELRHVGLGNAQNLGDFTLFQLLVFEDFEDMVSDLRARRSWSASLRPKSAKTFPEPSSNSIAFRLFELMCQLLCFGVSLFEQVNFPLRCLNTFLRLLLKGVQNINSPADLVPEGR
jgi:hypothetical protein